MNISDYMTPDPITVFSGMSLPEARRTLNENYFRHLPVVDQEGVLIGIITDRDLRSAYPSSVVSQSDKTISYEQVEQKTVADIMTTSCSTLGPDAKLEDALLIFNRDQVGGIPVVTDEGRVVGLFSLLDLTGAYSNIFGVLQKDSVPVVIEDDGRENIMSEIVNLLEQNETPFSQVIRLFGKGDVNKIFIRINNKRPLEVYKVLRAKGFIIL